MTPNPAPLPTTPPSPVDAANALGESVRKLIAERDALIGEVDFQRKMIETLNAKLDVSERDLAHFRGKAEYFERFSMTIAANFSIIRSIIDDTQRKADALARNPEVEEKAPPSPATDAIARVEDALSAALHGEGK